MAKYIGYIKGHRLEFRSMADALKYGRKAAARYAQDQGYHLDTPTARRQFIAGFMRSFRRDLRKE